MCRNLSKSIGVRLIEEDFKMVNDIAEKEETTISEVIRRIVRDYRKENRTE